MVSGQNMLKKSPFFDFLNRRGDTDFQQYLANFVEDADYIEWNGYLLPNDYGDSGPEYAAIRKSCAVFDVSPLRKYRITGSGSGAFLDRLLTRPASNAAPMRGIYVVFCNENGSLKDDAILHKYNDDDYFLLPSDIDHSAYFGELLEKFDIREVTITDCTHSWVGFALQGPLSATVLSRMGFDRIELLKPFEIMDFPLEEGVIRVARMGFTADLGYECWFQPEQRSAIENRIQSARDLLKLAIPGYGLTALQACRLEGGFIVAGWDCSTEADPRPGFERSPLELGLGWLVDLDAGPFVGKEALLEQQSRGKQYTIRSFEMNTHRVPDDGTTLYALVDSREQVVGSINCSAWSETLGKMIGSASVKSRYANVESAWTEMDGEATPVALSISPLLKFERARQVPAPLQ
jgi:aminomethyltransferase